MKKVPARAPKQPASERARTVGRVLRALELLASQAEPMRLVEIARALELPASSAHALLQELIRYDYAKPVGQERRYVQGSGLVLLGSRVRAGLQIVRIARPLLEDIGATTGENVYLGIRQARGVAYADAVEAESGVMARFPLGSIRPLHASSPGKIFLAFHVLPENLDRFLGSEPLQAYTRYTTTDRVKLRRQVEKIYEHGYAVNEQEAVEGAFGISTPIFGSDGTLAGCITVGMPGVRFKSRRAEAIKKAIAAATQISRSLGLQDWAGAVRSFRART